MLKSKKWIALLMAALLLCSMTGCGSEEKEEPAKEEVSASVDSSEVESSEKETILDAAGNDVISEEDEFEYEGDAASHYVDVYSGVLGNYYFALKEEWGAEELLSEGMSLLCMDFYGKDAVDQVGYSFLDLDNDGYWELVIGALNGQDSMNKIIFDAYTYKDGTVTQIFCGDARNRYYIELEEEAGYFIVNEGSAGAMNSCMVCYRYDGNELLPIQSILYDADADPENPWFMGCDDDWDPSNDDPIDEKLATDIIDSYTNRYVLPEYFLFSYYL